MTSFPLPVIRRVGGLEGSVARFPRSGRVIRRVGGLEVKREGEKALRDVIRRVGGLEVGTALHAATM